MSTATVWRATLESLCCENCLQLLFRAPPSRWAEPEPCSQATAQHGSDLCHEISSNSEHTAVQLRDGEELGEQFGEMGAEARTEPNGSLLCNSYDKQIFWGQGNLIFCYPEATGCFLLTCHFVLSPVQIGIRQFQTSWKKKNKMKACKKILCTSILAICWSKLNHIHIFESEKCIICIIYHIKNTMRYIYGTNTLVLNKWQILLVLEMELSCIIRQ